MVQFVEKKVNDLLGKPIRGTRLTTYNRKKGNIPLVTAGLENYGISDYIKHNTVLFDYPSITIDMFGNVFYRNYNFFADDNILVINLSKYIREVGLYLATTLQAATKDRFSYGKQFRQNSYFKLKIQVPVTATGALNTDYMASYVRKIEASYVRKIEAYLSVLGYKSIVDVKLTEHEQKLLAGGIQAQPTSKFRVGDLFTIDSTNSLNKSGLNSSVNAEYPYVTRTSINNGIESYTNFIDDEHLNPANSFSLGLLQMTLNWQKHEWYAGQFVRIIKPKTEMSQKIRLFIQTWLQKLVQTFDLQSLSISVLNVAQQITI